MERTSRGAIDSFLITVVCCLKMMSSMRPWTTPTLVQLLHHWSWNHLESLLWWDKNLMTLFFLEAYICLVSTWSSAIVNLRNCLTRSRSIATPSQRRQLWMLVMLVCTVHVIVFLFSLAMSYNSTIHTWHVLRHNAGMKTKREKRNRFFFFIPRHICTFKSERDHSLRVYFRRRVASEAEHE